MIDQKYIIQPFEKGLKYLKLYINEIIYTLNILIITYYNKQFNVVTEALGKSKDVIEF